jgi:hypothetical protein
MIADIRTPGIPDYVYGNSSGIGMLGAAAALGATGAGGALAAGSVLGASGALAGGALGALAGGLGAAALGAGAMMGSAVLGVGAAAGGALAKEALSNPLSLIPGKLGVWAGSGRYDYPAGGEIDFFNNRLCFDEPCQYDPENTGDFGMEWLRRSAPMTDYPYPPVYHRLHVEVPKPDREMSLIPYGDAASAQGNCVAHKVYMSKEAPVLKQAGIMPMYPVRSIKDFI